MYPVYQQPQPRPSSLRRGSLRRMAGEEPPYAGLEPSPDNTDTPTGKKQRENLPKSTVQVGTAPVLQLDRC